jgi:ankyrin repeat domain-containing protein 50
MEIDTVIIKYIFKACQNGDLCTMQKLIKNKGYNVNVTNTWGNTLLHIASEYGHIEIVDYLVSNGANVNLLNGFQNTPLSVACFYEHIDIVSYLLQHQADPNTVCESNQNALYFATLQGNLTIVELLVNYGAVICAKIHPNLLQNANYTVLHEAVRRGHFELVEFFLNKHVNPNIIDDTGCTPLHLACQYGFIKIAQILVARGANINAYDYYRNTCLDFAFSNFDTCSVNDHLYSQKIELIMYLMEQGAYTITRQDRKLGEDLETAKRQRESDMHSTEMKRMRIA